MQVAIDARMILPEMTGIGRYLLGLAGALRDLQDTNAYELWLQSGLPEDHLVWKLQSPRLKLRELSLRHMDYRQQWLLPAEVRRRKPDLLHYPHFDLPVAVSGPVVATIHDLKYIARPDFFPTFSRSKQLVMKKMVAFTVRRAERVIAVSESTREDLISLTNVAADKIAVIHEGVNKRFFQKPPQASILALRQRYNLPEDFILFVGERRPHKNIPGLLRAFEILSRKCHHQLVIVGKSYADYREPERLAQAYGLSQKVHFLDHVSDEVIRGLYHTAEAFACLSFYEGFGLPVLEAMACGTPVVAANKSALPEITGDAGVLVDPDDAEQVAAAMQQVIEDEGMRKELVRRGLERAHSFTWEKCAQETLGVYREAVALWQ